MTFVLHVSFDHLLHLSLLTITMSLADYLAKNYLTADSKPDKKSKKRKRKDGSNGLVIADDDSTAWKAQASTKDNEDGPLTGSHLYNPQNPYNKKTDFILSQPS